MDRKSYLVLGVCLLLLFLWGPLVNRIFPPIPIPPGSETNQVAEAQSPVEPSLSVSGERTSQEGAGSAPAAIPAAPVSNEPEKFLTLESDRLALRFTSKGGGLQTVQLKSYPAQVTCDAEGATAEGVQLLPQGAPSAFSLEIPGISRGDEHYELSEVQGGVRAVQTLPNGLEVTKTFSASSGYLIHVDVQLRNTTTNLMRLVEPVWHVGGVRPAHADEDGMYDGFFLHNGEEAEHIKSTWFANRTLGCIPGTPRTEFRSQPGPVQWVAPHNQFFTFLTLSTNAPAQGAQCEALEVEWSEEELAGTRKKNLSSLKAYAASMVGADQKLAAGATASLQFTAYAGPKEYNSLVKLGGELGQELDAVMDFGGFFGIFSKALLWAMGGLHQIGFAYGWAIVAITIFIKILFWPLTRASTLSMKRMAALQPQMKEIQEKYKSDPQKMNMKMMEFMREHKVSPLGGCLPMLIQMPVFFGFFFMIKSAVELRGADFLWICDLSRSDTVATIPGLDFPINPMPILMGVTMILQARLQPPSPGMDPAQQKIMKYMPLMFMVFLYNFSSGLTLYWTVQNILTIIQTKLTRNIEVTTPAAAKRPVPGHSGPKRRR